MTTALNPHTIRRIDAWLGVPLCWLLTACRRLTAAFGRRRIGSDPPKKIVFLKLVELGAHVQAHAAVERAAAIVGRQNVFFWVFDDSLPILDLLGQVPRENIFVVRSKGLLRMAADLLGTLWHIRRRRIDAVVDMEFFARASAVLSWLSGARRRVGLHGYGAGPYRGDLMTHRVQHNPYTHVSAYFLMLVEALAGDPADEPMPKRPLPPPVDPPVFTPSAAELATVRRALDEAAGRRVGGPIALLNANASDIVPLRKWPAERFVQLGQRLLTQRPDLTVVFTGAKAERARAEELCRAIGLPRALNLAGRTTLRELLALYCLADVLVTNDSGPGQFAGLTPIDAVVLFGPETPRLWGPLGPRAHALWTGLACSPCINPMNFRFSACRDPRCMRSIGVDEVAGLVDRLLAERARRQSAA